MKFIINQEISWTQKERVIILERDEDYFNHGRLTKVRYHCNVVIKTTEDWNNEDKFPIVGDTSSIQLRPKGLYKNKKGVYYKGPNKKIIYLTDGEVNEMNRYIEEAIEFLT